MTQAETLVELLSSQGLTCATAESCTGGMVGAAITDVAGASAVFSGGVISYSNEVKREVLGVDENILNSKGAVSGECAMAMARGVRRIMKSDIAVSVTGIAGPGGGSKEKPVGLVWFGLADAVQVRAEKAIFTGDRNSVRDQAVRHALGMIVSAAMPHFCGDQK